MYFLDAAISEASSSANYFPIGVQFLFAIGFVAVMMGATHFLAQKEARMRNCKILKAE